MHGLNHLLNSALKRHGIAKQVTATIIVQRANDLLASMARHPLAGDVRAVTFNNNVLVIACKHSAASYDVQALLPQLKLLLEQHFPDKTFSRVVTRISPAEWYNRDAV